MREQKQAAAFRDPRQIGPDTRLVRETGGKKLVHAIDCEKIQDWNADGLEPIGRFNPKHMKACPVCASRIYPMERAKDYARNRMEYARLFKEYGVHPENLEKLYYGIHAKTFLSGSRMYVETRTERWEITFLGEGKVSLGHGNYRVEPDDTRTVLPRYHEHELRRKTLDGAIREITGYKYEEARKRHRIHRDSMMKGKKTVRQILEELERESKEESTEKA